MTYLITTNHPGDLDSFRAVCARVDAHAAGLVARYAGMNEHGLAITSVWDSKAACDRFTVHHLLPALNAVVGGGSEVPPPSSLGVFVAFEAAEELSPERTP